MSENTETQTPEYTRAFWPSDYRKAAKLVRNMRHVRCDPYTAKDAASLAKADQMAIAVAEVFAADCQGFNPAVFIGGTALAVKPSYGSTDEYDDGTEDEGSDDE